MKTQTQSPKFQVSKILQTLLRFGTWNLGLRTFYVQYTIIIAAVLFSACGQNKEIPTKPLSSKHEKTIGIQPFDDFDVLLIDSLKPTIKAIYGYDAICFKSIPMYEEAFTDIKSERYRADTLIRYLKQIKPDSVKIVLGLTNVDISTTKYENGKIKKPEDKYEDYGIYGLGYMPGKSCIVSTYRIKTKNKALTLERFLKVCIHEIGHNLGLPHCETPKCVMNDVAESIKTIDEGNLTLCDSCKKSLKIK